MALARYEDFSGADLDLTTSAKFLYGYSVRENAATPAAATLLIRNGGATGDIVVAVELPADGSETVAFGHPVRFPDGVYVDQAAGTVQGSVFVQ